MAYYDNIAKLWHQATGYKGGAFKELVLNKILIEKFPGINDRSILELGAGNGYFLPLALRRFSGQVPSKIIITDQSQQLLEIAKRHFRISDALYQVVDVAKSFPFDNKAFDLIIASMVFNEVSERGFKQALKECQRISTCNSLLLITVIHPDFVDSLQKRGMLKMAQGGMLTMPGAGTLRLPVVIRSLDSYRICLQEAGFQYEETELFSTPEVLNSKAGLRHAGSIPIALIFACTKSK